MSGCGVLRVHYGPHEQSVMHSHPAHVAVILSDFHIRFGMPDGTTQEVSGAAGQAISVPAGDHLPENLSDQPLEAILIELKGD